ncbi:holin [Streptomyces sp. NPDC006458]|uniref:holin n=1 Tax=Streptomyces sp. NPDC006458 TaxID=3154302 RepID=UPI0033A363DD
MARRAMSICSTPGCPEYTNGGRCADCRAAADRRRGTSTQRGYGARHRSRFRDAVLARDPACVCTITSHGHDSPCGQPSRHADHHPLSRRDLVARGQDPDDPQHGRGLCHRCHSAETAEHQPGGWNQ